MPMIWGRRYRLPRGWAGHGDGCANRGRKGRNRLPRPESGDLPFGWGAYKFGQTVDVT